jgi:hypothetical protein
MDPVNNSAEYCTTTPSESTSTASLEVGVNKLSLEVFQKYPPDSTVTKLTSLLEIKRTWLYNEWSAECQFSKHIRPSFPNREALAPDNLTPDISLIEFIFRSVRGDFLLWQKPREEGRWKKVIVANLNLDWVLKNVEILYPSKEEFPVSELEGIVLWREKKEKKYKLYEGNHRISAWKNAGTPQTLPAVLYIGKPKK